MEYAETRISRGDFERFMRTTCRDLYFLWIDNIVTAQLVYVAIIKLLALSPVSP